MTSLKNTQIENTTILEGGKKKKSVKKTVSKKVSKKTSSKKTSKKVSKKASKGKKNAKIARVDINEKVIDMLPDTLWGGKKAKKSKKVSKSNSVNSTSSKKVSKKNSKKSGSKKASKVKRALPPALVESNLTNKKISAATGVGIGPALMKFVKSFREQAKKTIKDEKDFMAINKKTVEIFNDYLNKNGKAKIVSEIESIAANIKKNRSKPKA